MLGLWGLQNTQSSWPHLNARLWSWVDTDTSGKFHGNPRRYDLSSEPIERRAAKATRQGAEVTHQTASAGQKGPEPERPSTTTSSAPRLRSLQYPRRPRALQQPRRPRRRTTPGGARTAPEVSLRAPDATRRLWLPGRRALPRAAGTRNWTIRTGFLGRAWTAGLVLSEFPECSFTWARKWVFPRAPSPPVRPRVPRAIPASRRRNPVSWSRFAPALPTFLPRPPSDGAEPQIILGGASSPLAQLSHSCPGLGLFWEASKADRGVLLHPFPLPIADPGALNSLDGHGLPAKRKVTTKG